MLSKLSRREKDAGIEPDHEIDAFMKATALEGQKTSLATDYILKVLGLDICADIIIDDEMRRGISGGQKKRVTTDNIQVKFLHHGASRLSHPQTCTKCDCAIPMQLLHPSALCHRSTDGEFIQRRHI